MRRKKFLGRALSLSLALAMTVPATNVLADTNTSAQDKVLNDAGIQVNSKEAAVELKELCNNNQGNLKIYANEENEITNIDGTLSKENVDSVKDARDVIEGISNLLGIENTDSEIRFANSSNGLFADTYDFVQYYKGLEVINGCVTVAVNKETGEADYLNSTYDSTISVDTEASLKEEEAVSLVENKYSVKTLNNARLVIYNGENGAKLAWKISTDSMALSEVLVDAHNGEVLLEVMPYNAEEIDDYSPISYHVERSAFHTEEKDLIFPFSSFNVNLAENEGTYKLYDMERNICEIPTSDYADFDDCYTTNDLSNYYTPLAVLRNVEKAYDFYGAMGWYGPDGKKSRIYVMPEYTKDGKDYCANAYCSPRSNGEALLMFGIGNASYQQYGDRAYNYAADIDIVTHEFTHGVTHNKIHWIYTSEYKGEALSLCEAYSDIMGELNDGTREWQIGTDIYPCNTDINTTLKKQKCIRDLANPTCGKYTTSAQFREIGGHRGSQVISYAAYLMYEKGISIDDLKQIWFGSLDYLPHNTMDIFFTDCRRGVLETATNLCNRRSMSESDKKAYLDKIKEAFREVNVLAENEILGDFNLDGKVDSQDVEDLSSYIAGEYQITDEVQLLNGDINGDGILNVFDVIRLQRVGDVNMDGKVNEDDVDYFRENFTDSDNWSPLQKYFADVNSDGTVDVQDYTVLSHKVNAQQ